MPYRASAPGSLMLLGEYGVLHGKYALVCAVNKRLTVTLTPRKDDRIEITSPRLGHYATTLSALTIEPPFRFILGALTHYKTRLKMGCDIEISADFSDQVGLGSSAAVTVATIATLFAWLSIHATPTELLHQSRNVVRMVQGVGSGADVAASVYGGIVGYQAQPLSTEKFSLVHPLTALYAGYKTPTVEAIKKVQESFSSQPNLLRSLINGIGQCAIDGIQAVRKKDWQKLGAIMNVQQGLMESLGVNNVLLRQMVDYLHKQPEMLGAKISGAGLGDCVIGLGNLSEPIVDLESAVTRIPLEMTLQGVLCEKI